MSPIIRKTCTGITIGLLILFLLLAQFGSPLAGLRMERQVYSLLRNQGYGVEEIGDIQILYNPDERYAYKAEVFFRDHGGYTRRYIYNSEQELQELEQIGR